GAWPGTRRPPSPGLLSRTWTGIRHGVFSWGDCIISRQRPTSFWSGLDSWRHVSYGLGTFLSRGASRAYGAGGRLLDRPSPGDESAVHPLRGGPRLRTRRR